jgi:vacuolar-type H+-ATPase subunit I/STV1
MSRKLIVFLFIILNLTTYSEVLCAPWSSPKYKAETLIRVLPYAERDPLTFETPPIDKDTQYIFRNSMATLMRQKSFLTKLFKSYKIRETNWYRSITENQDDKIQKAVKNLEENFIAKAEKDTDFIKVSFICEDKVEAGSILDQIVEHFINTQGEIQKKTIMERLSSLTSRRDKVQQELEYTHTLLEQVRGSLPQGYINLDLYSYSDPVFIRLNRLHELRDDLALEISGHEAIKNHMGKNEEDVNEADYELMILYAKNEKLDKMLAEAIKSKENHDRAKYLYDNNKQRRDERQAILNSINQQIEKLRMVADDPFVSKLQSMGPAEAFPLD